MDDQTRHTRPLTGRVTIPTDMDVVPQTLEIMKRWGADGGRDCDGKQGALEGAGHVLVPLCLMGFFRCRITR